jgi:23S rRNA pseudouridine1911/1915/1917 synthase
MTSNPHVVTDSQAGQTVAAVVRMLQPDLPWSKAKGLVTSRRVKLGGDVCMDPARRVKAGETLELLTTPVKEKKEATSGGVVIRHLDDDVVVVEKASGLNTVRHPAELNWGEDRRLLAPTLQDITQDAVALRLGRKKSDLPRLRIVHRLDKETSGLVVFARSVVAERDLGRQFKAHTVLRRYFTMVEGYLPPQTISSWLIRDRGDGRRGSAPAGSTPGDGKHATTHIDVVERMAKATLLVCQLETGRTHQIRIHLSEAGHFVLGEPVYRRRRDGSETPDDSGAPRLALHAAELGFQHPSTGKDLFWQMPLPHDLETLRDRLRKG